MPIQYQVEKADIELPSRGLLYPENSPLSKGVITIHHMTAREEDILSSRNLLRKGQALDELLKSCIETPNIDPLDILNCDRNAIFIAIRVSGFGSEYPIQVTCPSCGNLKSQTHIIDLSSLDVEYSEHAPLQPHSNLFEFKLPKTGLHIKFKLLTGRDELNVSQLQEKTNPQSEYLTVTNEHEITLRMKQMILEIDGETNRSVISDAINSLPVLDSRAFRKFVDTIEPGVNMKSSFTCNYCGSSEVVDIPISTDFFWPSL